MYSKLTLTGKYLAYYLRSKNRHGLHSPFVYRIADEVLRDRKHYYAYDQVEGLRRQLLADHSELEVEDFGAGSVSGAGSRRRVCDIARLAAKPARYARLLFRLAAFLEPKLIVELGSSLGISSAYLALASPAGKLITCEGSPAIANRAMENFDSLGLKNIEMVQGNFNDTLPGILAAHPGPGLVFFDGNHRCEPTLQYFRQCLAAANEDTVFIFDDIHWSSGMEAAWATIKADKAVRMSIDLFFIGLVFFRKEFKAVQHFELRF